MSPTGACESCLRRSWLIERLSGHIETASARGPGRRVAEILSLSDSELVEAVAPRQRAAIEAEMGCFDPGGMRRRVEGSGAWTVCRHKALLPPGLADLGDPPVALFGKGDPGRLGELTPSGAVTVVGSRRATVYGLGVAKDLGRELAMSGLAVVSGLAMGIDGAAHTGALEAGLSCAVLGCGVDRAYPARHERLYERHVERGLVLSELPAGARPWRWTFPARNRIMAALTGMTVVVEAADRSGSLITATFAQELGRDAGAVPGPVTSRASTGCNELLSSGACVVRGAQDVLDAMLGAGEMRPSPSGPELSGEMRVALATFEEHDGNWERVSAQLLGRGIPPEAALAQLELLGYLRCSALGTWTRTSLRPPA